jgi:hypothetical protein
VIAAVIGFVVGIGVGIVASIIAAVAILSIPPPKREIPVYSAIGAGRARTTGPEDLFDAIDRRLR